MPITDVLILTAEQQEIITPLNWEQDMELLSQFTDRKVSTSEGKRTSEV